MQAQDRTAVQGATAEGRGTATAPDGPPLAEVIPLRDPPRPVRRWRWRRAGVRGDAGMATAEYAVVLLAAVGFAGLLIVILTSSEIRETLTGLVRGALAV